MAKRVDLDAMIPREDFAIAEEVVGTELIRDFPISLLASDSAILRLLRKPDFQRETNHWSPDQLVSLIASFVDNEVIPSIILWKSPKYLFVIDGAHRLSALRAWMEDDYGDRAISLAFHKTITEAQKKVAKRARTLIEEKVGRYSSLKSLVGSHLSDSTQGRRSQTLVTRSLTLQWILGNVNTAESSFFKINSQGTPLDETEELLLKHRRKPVAIAARCVLRGGNGHKYWSQFESHQKEIEALSEQINGLLFTPQTESPLKTLDVPFGGSVAPVEALGLLVDFITLAANRLVKPKGIEEQSADNSGGQETVDVLKRTLQVINRITGNSRGSLGLHPAVYFYNERGKYSKFLFLGMVGLIADKIRDNDTVFFKKLTQGRSLLERMLLENKFLIGLVLQNMSKSQRVPKMKELFELLVSSTSKGEQVTQEAIVLTMGLRATLLEFKTTQTTPTITEDTRTMLFMTKALDNALMCPECGGYLHPAKSISYDHKIPVRSGGTGNIENVQLTHPYCNTAKDGLRYKGPIPLENASESEDI